jgi:hypothetical protein
MRRWPNQGAAGAAVQVHGGNAVDSPRFLPIDLVASADREVSGRSNPCLLEHSVSLRPVPTADHRPLPTRKRQSASANTRPAENLDSQHAARRGHGLVVVTCVVAGSMITVVMGNRVNSALSALDENSVNQRDGIMAKGLVAFDMALFRGRGGAVIGSLAAVLLVALLAWLY